MHADIRTEAAPQAPRVAYRRGDPAALLAEPGTLALFGFGAAAARLDDPRYLRLAAEPVDAVDAGVYEQWTVSAPVESGLDAGLRWSSGGGWLYAALDAGTDSGDVADIAAATYAQLADFIGASRHRGVLRMWNLLADINHGDGDDERYKRFCVGRGNGMDGLFRGGYPAATAVGHHDPQRPLQVYCLAGSRSGERIENPRQVSAWRYPRQYGPVPPSFARAMRLPAGDALAISGTAAISGHESRHVGDLEAQLAETLVNLHALLDAGNLAGGFDARAVLKVYLRNPADAPRVAAFLDRHAPNASRLLLHADICRRELQVEIDGWRYA